MSTRAGRAASVKDVAAAAGVSLGTVSNVLNRPDRVSVATRTRVQEAMADLGFVRNESARQLRAGTSRTWTPVYGDSTTMPLPTYMPMWPARVGEPSEPWMAMRSPGRMSAGFATSSPVRAWSAATRGSETPACAYACCSTISAYPCPTRRSWPSTVIR